MPNMHQPLLLVSLVQVATAASTPAPPPFMPLRFSYGGYPKTMADISFGTSEQTPPIATVVDSGSPDYWVYGAGAIANYGGTGPFGVGPCNHTLYPTYDPSKSSSASEVTFKENYGFSYGNGGKAIRAYGTVNDTLHFGAGFPALVNQQVAVSNFSTSRINAAPNCTDCEDFETDNSILGISPFFN